ncbi:MAG: hypothetical protein ACEPOW_09150 [Bacteroidales bacterium]
MIRKIIIRPNFDLDELMALALILYNSKESYYFGRRGRLVEDKDGIEIILSHADEQEINYSDVAVINQTESTDYKKNNFHALEGSVFNSVLASYYPEVDDQHIQALVKDIVLYNEKGLNADERPASLYTIVEYYKFGFQEKLLLRAVDFCLSTLKGILN